MAYSVAAPFGQFCLKCRSAGRKFLRYFAVHRKAGQQAIIQIARSRRQTNFCQFLHGKTANRRSQYRCQRNILTYIVDDCEQGQHQPHLCRLKVAAIYLRIGGNTAFPQGFEQDAGLAADCPHQHCNIPELQRTIGIAVFIEDHIALLHQLADAPGDIGRLQFEAGQILGILLTSICRRYCLFLRTAPQDQVQFHSTIRPGKAMHMSRIILARIKLAVDIVFYFSCPSGHDLVKDKINRRQHLFPAAEVLLHIDQLILIFCRWFFGETIVLGLKEIGIGQAETIDALLHIANCKAVVLAGNEIQDSLLHAVGILILIHHDRLIFLLQGSRSGTGHNRPRFVISTEDCQRKMLQIVEIQNIALLFRFLQRPAKIQRQLRINRSCPLVGRKVFRNLGSFLSQIIIGKILQGFLYRIPPAVKLFADIRIEILEIVIDFSPHSLPGEFADLPDQFIPRFSAGISLQHVKGFADGIEPRQILLHQLSIRLPGRRQGRIILPLAQGGGFLILADNCQQAGPHLRHCRSQPWRIGKVLILPCLLALQPLFRKRLALRKSMQP